MKTSSRNKFIYVITFTLFSIALTSMDDRELNSDIDNLVIFNGKDLDGLSGDKKWWRVENGELIGASISKKVPEDFSWLVTDSTYSDFELKLWCKLSGDGNRNSGIYYRGKWNEEGYVTGYEFDLGGWGGEKELWWGELHDPFGRELFAPPILSKDELIDLYNKKGWNHIRIRAEGNHIQHWLNGTKTMDWHEEDSTMQHSGFIGFQMHNETKFKVRFRDIQLTLLSK